ncbi:MAG: polysaccharide deacetylase family protein [Clostridia bacterium]|nr:polysaccharide deacetylase family protein [Clostridia bacterium]
MSKIEVFYPNYSRKAITFSIDDGNVTMDKKFIDIVKPHGIRGTFNLLSDNLNAFDAQGYRDFYDGFEISNHVKYHPQPFIDGVEYKITDAPFCRESADYSLTYKTDVDGLYYISKGKSWRFGCGAKDYIRFTKECNDELEAIFGEGSVKGFVWPYGKQPNMQVYEELCKMGFYGLRITGNTVDKDGFAIPKDRNNWSYNANNTALLDVAKMYEEYEDDGELKFFCFGVHSFDFERSGNWNELVEFAEKYGDRPSDYWYCTVYEAFSYEDAVKALKISEDKVENTSDIAVYITVDGVKRIVAPHSLVEI